MVGHIFENNFVYSLTIDKKLAGIMHKAFCPFLFRNIFVFDKGTFIVYGVAFQRQAVTPLTQHLWHYQTPNTQLHHHHWHLGFSFSGQSPEVTSKITSGITQEGSKGVAPNASVTYIRQAKDISQLSLL
jgi:hypothetical protein